MSRTFKDAPDARRRFADREIQFTYKPAAGDSEADTAVPADPWAAFDDLGLSRASRLAGAAFLGLTGEPSADELAAAPCPHTGPAAEQRRRAAEGRVLGDVLARAELSLIAGGQ